MAFLFHVKQDVDPTNINDDFTGNDGDPPNPIYWIETDSGDFLAIKDNELAWEPNTPAAVDAKIESTFAVQGDFDITVDYAAVLDRAGDHVTWDPLFQLYDLTWSTNIAYVGRARSGTNVGWGANHVYGWGLDQGTQFDDNTNITGGLRIERVSGVIKVYNWRGGAWQWSLSTAGLQVVNNNTSDVMIRFYWNESSGAPQCQGTIDNFELDCDNWYFV